MQTAFRHRTIPFTCFVAHIRAIAYSSTIRIFHIIRVCVFHEKKTRNEIFMLSKHICQWKKCRTCELLLLLHSPAKKINIFTSWGKNEPCNMHCNRPQQIVFRDNTALLSHFFSCGCYCWIFANTIIFAHANPKSTSMAKCWSDELRQRVSAISLNAEMESKPIRWSIARQTKTFHIISMVYWSMFCFLARSKIE